MSNSGFLSPYRVVDLTADRALLAGQMLAQLGAEVIQVEPPAAHDASSASFVRTALTAGKRSVTCDIDHPGGRVLLRRLLETADILIESEAPDSRARRGLDAGTLREAFPHLVHVSIGRVRPGLAPSVRRPPTQTRTSPSGPPVDHFCRRGATSGRRFGSARRKAFSTPPPMQPTEPSSPSSPGE